MPGERSRGHRPNPDWSWVALPGSCTSAYMKLAAAASGWPSLPLKSQPEPAR